MAEVPAGRKDGDSANWQGGQSSAHRRYEKWRARLVPLKSDEGGSDTPYQAAAMSAANGGSIPLRYCAVLP